MAQYRSSGPSPLTVEAEPIYGSEGNQPARRWLVTLADSTQHEIDDRTFTETFAPADAFTLVDEEPHRPFVAAMKQAAECTDACASARAARRGVELHRAGLAPIGRDV